MSSVFHFRTGSLPFIGVTHRTDLLAVGWQPAGEPYQGHNKKKSEGLKPNWTAALLSAHTEMMSVLVKTVQKGEGISRDAKGE